MSLVDMSNTEARQGFSPVPAGKYLVQATEAQVKTTRAQTGRFIEVVFKVVEPTTHEGKRIWERFNIQNPNDEAERIGKESLKGFLVAAAFKDPNRLSDVNELLGLQAVASVKVKQNSVHGDSNEIKFYESRAEWEKDVPADAGSPQGRPPF